MPGGFCCPRLVGEPASIDVTNGPLDWTSGHHIVPWADGGETALSNACLLCLHHHTLIHTTDGQVRLDADGFPEFIPPESLDPQRRPRQKAFYRRE
jgi:hypothetical protein